MPLRTVPQQSATNPSLLLSVQNSTLYGSTYGTKSLKGTIISFTRHPLNHPRNQHAENFGKTLFLIRLYYLPYKSWRNAWWTLPHALPKRKERTRNISWTIRLTTLIVCCNSMEDVEREWTLWLQHEAFMECLRMRNKYFKIKLFNDIKFANPTDNKIFHRLIQKQNLSSGSLPSVASICIKCHSYSGHRVLKRWETYFG